MGPGAAATGCRRGRGERGGGAVSDGGGWGCGSQRWRWVGPGAAGSLGRCESAAMVSGAGSSRHPGQVCESVAMVGGARSSSQPGQGVIGRRW